jgi:tripartite-type tricarboxylate transporter receptor subunit TctC
MTRLFVVLAALAGFAFAASPASAKYPDRSINIIVPVAPGGPADMVARVVAQKLQERLGQSVTVDNKPGALGLIAAEMGAHAKPDGYTVVMVSSGLAIQAATQSHLFKFDVLRDLTPITYAVKVPMVVATRTDQPFKTMKEFVAYAKTKPGQLSVGVTPGLGGTGHLTLERLKLGTGMNVIVVPYKGSSLATQALLSGEVTAIIDTLAGMAGYIDSGKVRALATLTEMPAINHEKLPTIADAGFPGYAADTWNGFMVPGGTPKDIVDLLQREIAAIMALPDVKERVLSQGLEPAINTPEQFSRSFKAAITQWAKVAADAHLKFD